MHAVGQAEHRRPIKSRQQQRAEPAVFRPAPGQPEQRQRGGRNADRPQGLPAHKAQPPALLRLPVAAHQGEQVEPVQAGVGVAVHRAGVFFQQPASRLLCTLEGQAAQPHHRHGNPGSQRRAPQNAQRPPRLPPGQKRRQKAHRQHRAEQQRLGLDRQRQPVNGGRGQILFFVQQPERPHQRQGKHPVHLLPHAGIVQKGRAKGGKGRQPQRPRPAQKSPGNPPHQRSQPQIAQNGHGPQYQGKALALVSEPQHPRRLARSPQHQHIGGRIIGKIVRRVKLPRPHIRQAERPGRNAGNIRRIALGDQQQRQPHRKRSGKDHRKALPAPFFSCLQIGHGQPLPSVSFSQ